MPRIAPPLAVATFAVFTAACGGGSDATRTLVGKLLYHDVNLSTPPGQSCASCHSPQAGFADPDRDLPVSRGVKPWLTGNRNSPTAAYAAYSPSFHFDTVDGVYVGGQFWDGRAATLEEQAKGPFLNPLEMANPDEAAVVQAVRQSEYARLFEEVFGQGALSRTEMAYDQIAEAIAAFERTAEVSPFTSKFDHSLQGTATLAAAEARGLALFNDPAKGNCAACHPSTGVGGNPPLFTDFTYDNLGVPKNPLNPFYQLAPQYNPDGAAFVDRGLGQTTGQASEDGKFKVPTLRNLALTAPYMHNGVFATMKEVVEFYNTRDTDPQRWGAPEVAANVNQDELGNLGLSAQEVDDIVAFLGTLADGWVAP